MSSTRRFCLRALIALLLVTMTIPGEALRPDPAEVAAAALRGPDVTERSAPATPGTYRSATSAASTAILSITIAKPTGLTTNDVMLAAITVRSAPTVTPPAGWTLVRADVSGTALSQHLYRKVATGSEPSTYSWTFDAPVPAAVGGISAYSGVDTTTPVDVSGGQANASSATVTAPSVTTTVANARLVGLYGTANDGSFSPPSGMTERYDAEVEGSTQASGSAADVNQAAAGASGTKAATASISAVNIGQLVALRPSGTIAFRAASYGVTIPTTSLTVNKPSGTVEDDVLLASITTRALEDVTAPAGWSLVRADTNGSTVRQSIYVRAAGASEPASYTWTFAGPVSTAVGGIIAVDGLDPVDPVDVSGGQTNASSTSVTAPSITTTVSDATLVGLYATANDATFTAPSGMTERFDVLAVTTSDAAATAADVSVAATGATGTKVATASKTGVNIGALVALRPATTVANLGIQSQHAFESWDLGAGDSLTANVATRNVVIGHPIVSLPIRGSAVSINATYNAKDRSDVGMGPGWRLDVVRRLRVNGDATVTLTDGSGARHTFTSPSTVGSLTSYTRPATIYATLVKDTTPNPDRFTLTYRDQSLDRFDVSGGEAMLVREQDRFGNGVDLAYSGTNLSTITDTVPTPDRIIDFTWDTGATPDHLTTITDWAYISGGVVQTSATGSRRVHDFFYDGSGRLEGWTDPLNTTSTSCGTTAPHLTCLTYTNGLVTGIAKTQTITTESTGTLGTDEAHPTTTLTYSGSDVATITDAEAGATTFTQVSSTLLRVDRPTTTTSFGLVGAGDAYGRIQSVWRKLDVSTSLETRTTYDGTYPIEPATVTANYGALLSTPARTTTYTYVASSMGLLAKIVEPLNATDDRWTEYTYNTNNDVVAETVSFEGSGSDTTTTKSCYTTQSNSCSDASPGLTLVRQISRWVSGGASDEDTNVVTDYGYDAYGQLTSTTRANRNGAGSLLDSREDRQVYDDKGNQTSSITNYANGTITPATLDTEPAAGDARTDLTTVHTYDTAGNQVSTADPRRAIGLAASTAAHDAFARTVVDDWGTADTGGSWSGEDATFDVASGTGTIALSSNTNKNAFLTSPSIRDLEFVMRVKVDRLAVGSDHFVWAYLRRQDSSNYYQARLTFSTSGSTVLSLREVDAGTTTVLDAATTSVPHATTDWYWLRVRLTGTTTLDAKARLWKDGTTEPSDWTVEATDASPPAALQNAGNVGLRFQVGGSYSGSYPVIASFDDVALTTPGGGGPEIDVDDYISRTTYDALDRAITSSTPTTPGVATASRTATTTYDELGDVRLTTDIADLVNATVYDQAGRAIETYQDPDPAGSVELTSLMTYDADGKLLTAMDRRQANDPGFDLGWTAFAYDGLGRQTMVTQASNSDPDVESETVTTYDGLDRTTATEVGYGSASSQLTGFTYDLGGRTLETDDGFTCASATYDYRDLVLVTEDSLDTSTCAANADSRTVTNAYDGLGRLTAAEVTNGPDDGDKPVIATYDAVGKALTRADLTGGVTMTTTLTSNLLDQLVAEARGDGSDAKTTYDPVGNPVDRCTWAAGLALGDCLAVGTDPWTDEPSRSTTTRWDARNGRIGLTDSESNRTTVYDPDFGYQVSAVYLPTDPAQTKEHQSLYGYDSRYRLTSITHQLCPITSGHACAAPTTTGSAAYLYDDADNRTQVDEDNGAASADYRYCHDALGQLTARRTGAACTSSPDETYTYDPAGNRLTIETTIPSEAGFAYTVTGLLCDVDTTDKDAAICAGGNIASDDAGRIGDIAGWHYLYDAQARLVSVCDDADCVGSGFDRVDYTYDGDGHRTAITETPAAGSPVVTTTFRYQGDAIVAESVGGTLTREYVTDDTGTISKVIVPVGQTGAGTYLVTWNGHGDAMALYRIETNGSLTLANSYTYSTWGAPTTATHNSIADLKFRFLYVGAYDVQWDDQYGLGLTYMHARHYSPTLGRFLQPDPSRLDAQLFVYAKNGPVSRIDPSGLTSVAVSFNRTGWGSGTSGYTNAVLLVASVGFGWGSQGVVGGIYSGSGLYSGPSANGTLRRLWVNFAAATLKWGRETEVLGGGAEHRMRMNLSLRDYTTGKTLKTWTLASEQVNCWGSLKFLAPCFSSFGGDKSGVRFHLPFDSRTSIIKGHRYQISYDAWAYAAVGGGWATTYVSASNMSGSIQW